MKAEIKYKGLVDRIEGPKAVIFLGEDERESLDMAKGFLPEGVKEGDILSFKIKLESRKTKEAKEKVNELIERLKNK